jgi:hypothetical protein
VAHPTRCEVTCALLIDLRLVKPGSLGKSVRSAARVPDAGTGSSNYRPVPGLPPKVGASSDCDHLTRFPSRGSIWNLSCLPYGSRCRSAWIGCFLHHLTAEDTARPSKWA